VLPYRRAGFGQVSSRRAAFGPGVVEQRPRPPAKLHDDLHDTGCAWLACVVKIVVQAQVGR